MCDCVLPQRGVSQEFVLRIISDIYLVWLDKVKQTPQQTYYGRNLGSVFHYLRMAEVARRALFMASMHQINK